MKYIYLIWKNVWRRKIRTIFTLLSILIAFTLFAGLMTIRTAFSFGVDMIGLDRLIVIDKVALVNPLPLSYQSRLAGVDGVEIATHSTWFGGIYQDPANFFAQIVVDPEPFMQVYQEYQLPDDQMAAWLADRQGAIVGRDLANRFDWEIGDRIPLQATIWQPADGSGSWEFNIVGIYDGEDGVDKTQLFFRYDYLDENRAFGEGVVGWYIVKIADASQSEEMANEFDRMFANSPSETKTTTEKGFLDGFAKQVGDIGAIMVAILSAVLFTILLVAANTMAQSVRERTSELAVLKTLGFTGRSVLGLVLGESLFLAVVGGGIGLFAGWLLVQAVRDTMSSMLPIWLLSPTDIVVGVILVLLLGTLAGLPPAIAAMRLRITDALRRA